MTKPMTPEEFKEKLQQEGWDEKTFDVGGDALQRNKELLLTLRDVLMKEKQSVQDQLVMLKEQLQVIQKGGTTPNGR